MGREIRRVPLDWEHPRYTPEQTPRGMAADQYQPMHDEVYEDAAAEWMEKVRCWEAGEDPDRAEYDARKGRRTFYWEWDGGPPDPDHYRHRRWTPEEATAFQVYENVSEGTPVSPVLPTVEALEQWLVDQGHSRDAARAFIEAGYAFSMVYSPETGLRSNIEMYER